MPEGTSMIPIYHYGQLHLLDFSMAHYDNGSSVVPPSPYELNHVTTPTAMFVGAGDTTADPTDNERLSNDLPNVFHYEVCYIQNQQSKQLLIFIIYEIGANDCYTYIHIYMYRLSRENVTILHCVSNGPMMTLYVESMHLRSFMTKYYNISVNSKMIID